MGSLSSHSTLFIFLLLFAFFTMPIQSEKSQQLTRRNLALSEQDPEEQPAPKPKPKKTNAGAAQIEQQEASVDQSIPKPKPKKKSSSQIEHEEEESGEQPIPKPKTKKKSSSQIEHEQESADQPIPKPITKKKNPILDSKNQTKPIKPKKSNSTSIPTLTSNPPKSSKLNKTLTLKPSNSTKIPKPPKNSTKTLNATKPIKPTKLNSTKTQLKTPKPAPKAKPVNPESIWQDSDPDLDSDLIAEFRDLPGRIHQTLLPDIKKISITSKAYIYKANKNIADNVKPYFGNKFAPKIALAASCLFLILPLCLVTALLYHLHSYLPLHRLLIFVQAYLAIYFLTLALTAVVTGLEPLRFFYATSPSSYAWTQAVQTLGYLLYLLVQLIHLVVVFSGGENKMGVRALGLVQMIMGLAVGCHYYAAVFHRAVTGDPPRANWKVHGIYAGCFLVICLCARAERRKKAYEGGQDGKLN